MFTSLCHDSLWYSLLNSTDLLLWIAPRLQSGTCPRVPELSLHYMPWNSSCCWATTQIWTQHKDTSLSSASLADITGLLASSLKHKQMSLVLFTVKMEQQGYISALQSQNRKKESSGAAIYCLCGASNPGVPAPDSQHLWALGSC